MNPLTDELSDEAKAELAAEFAQLRAMFRGYDAEQQRRLNRIQSRWYR